MFELFDTFNDQTLSKHRTFESAYQAGKQLDKDIRKSHGSTSYLPWRVDEVTPVRYFPEETTHANWWGLGGSPNLRADGYKTREEAEAAVIRVTMKFRGNAGGGPLFTIVTRGGREESVQG